MPKRAEDIDTLKNLGKQEDTYLAKFILINHV